jgi:hypothetical protein
MFLPGNSWVAKWNNLEGKKPGIYAINILEDLPEEDNQYYNSAPKNRRKQRNSNDQMYSDDEEGFYQ